MQNCSKKEKECADSKHTQIQGCAQQGEVFYFLFFFSRPSAVLTFVLRVAVLVRGRWWEVNAGRGTAQGRMSIITY